MFKLFVVLSKLSWLIATTLAENDPVVRTKYGLVRGTIETSLHGREFLAFNGIPYARPPVGELRLKPPLPPISWSGLLDVSKSPPYCAQPNNFLNPTSVKGREDCLFLGVYVPKSSSSHGIGRKHQLPVMVFIHGGGFSSGGGADYPPHYLMDKNIIYVSINYRLGALGFLGGFDELPGNYGLKDQSMALKWIQENIEAFGGNRNDVTLFGQSVGSASVSLHAFNPLSKGLYHKAILESATALSFGSLHNRENSVSMTVAFAAVTGCQSKHNTVPNLIECFRTLPVLDFITVFSKLSAWYPGSIAGGVFLPCIEGEDVPEAALPYVPSEDTLITKNIPYITGINSGEGTFLAELYFANDGQIINALGADYHRFIPLITALNVRLFNDQRIRLAESIKQYYFGGDNITNNLESAIALDEMFRDGIFMFSIVEILKLLQTADVPTYMYLYDYIIDCKDGWGCHNPKLGADHGDEQIMLFPVAKILNETYTYDKFTPREKNISTTLIDYWTNFAIYGDPNGDGTVPFWPTWNAVKQECLRITNVSYAIDEYVYEDRYNFWKNLTNTFNITIE